MSSWIVLLILIAAILIYSLGTWLYQRKIIVTLTEEEFKAGYRKAQLIDIRESNEFDAGHILGARNIPLTQLKMRLTEIRPDKPVYLYGQTELGSGRAAQLLYRKGIKDLYQLKGGFKKWTGKIKAKN